MDSNKQKLTPTYILYDTNLEKYYYFYTNNTQKEYYYSFCVERYDTPQAKTALVLDLLDVKNNWDPNIYYDTLLANSIYRQLDRCLPDTILIYENIIAIKNGNEKKLFWVKGSLEKAKLFVIIKKISDITFDKNMNASWEYQKSISKLFRSIDREWYDKYLEESKQNLKKALGNVINYENLKKNSVIKEYEEIIKHEKNAVTILNAERLFFDYSLFLHAAKELIPEIENVTKLK